MAKDKDRDSGKKQCVGNICVDQDTGEVHVDIDAGDKECPPEVVDLVLKAITRGKDTVYHVHNSRVEDERAEDQDKRKR